jgi:LmbE family N-acetylglucosaminyl deacetylase
MIRHDSFHMTREDGEVQYTLVVFHAHPDDEAIATAGTMAKAKAEGHRVVLVVATRGELGEHAPDVLAPGETLTDRRVAEQMAAAEIIGVDRVEFLGFHDSGMAGEPTNTAPGAFASADVDDAAARLAQLLEEERAHVLTIYDDHGGYGHPDHIQVHRVGARAAEFARTPVVLESTMNRDHVRRLMEMAPPEAFGDAEDRPAIEDLDSFGSPEEAITTMVDVREFTDRKRAAMRAHASQIPEDSFFLALPDEAFREAFGWEWFIRRGAENGTRETGVFDALS